MYNQNVLCLLSSCETLTPCKDSVSFEHTVYEKIEYLNKSEDCKEGMNAASGSLNEPNNVAKKVKKRKIIEQVEILTNEMGGQGLLQGKW